MSRALAFMIDFAVVFLATVVGGLAVQAVLSVVFRGVDTQLSVGWVVGIPWLFLIYSAVFWVLAAGRTPGKAALGLRVVRVDDRAIGWKTAVARAAGYVVSSILMIGFMWIAVDRRHQGFHDKLARTFVVYDTPE